MFFLSLNLDADCVMFFVCALLVCLLSLSYFAVTTC